ncbi:beta-galactosidase [Asticcacaulis sp. AND118]|uniref:beta-galactosidase n=1 Tax=Asticcacaulis sp. AND118 TaxID=2840468 RepID=UPI001CFFA3A1|nr:beta-galactosidase [Asticcacaulis sp. AND118]UDF02348.1 beta-galactosidase [Asticcacaulis sp. AND118]
MTGKLLAASTAALALLWSAASAETARVDAQAAPPAPREGLLKMGAGASPSGQVMAVNDRYLTIDGKPVLPVMGEFHYTRFPEQYWEEQLLKMKAGGVNVVATYVIWQHHQDRPDAFDWSGNRNLRKFIQLAQKHDLYVYLRPGPWAHAEVRFGGIPDWVVDSVPTRGNDPTYLGYVDAFFAQVAEQARGLLWKDGGPVIGIQIENEYNRTGPLQGREHISRLKDMLIARGFDVPLYTVTGWDNAVFPRGEVIPVFGTYVDEPWSASATLLPPKSSYMFQFGVRNEKGLGAQGRTSTQDDGARDTDITPFFGAEYGGGVPQMYRRRPIISPDDIADMVITKIGSGVNLLGYYMFQGGQNPPGYPSRDESVATGGFNDVPKLGYDFQAPLGQYGQAHPVLNKLKPIHYFLQSFGDRLAPMTVYAPEVKPAAADDLKTLRWAFRGDGKSGFVFVNNHIRQYETPAHPDTRFEVKLGNETLTLPSKGVTVAQGAAFIWPVHFDLSGVDLLWATAQPVTRIDDGQGDLYVFAASDKIPPEFVFAANAVKSVKGATQSKQGGQLKVTPEAGRIVSVTGANGKTARFILLSETQAQTLTMVQIQGRQHLILSEAHVFESPEGGAAFRQTRPDFKFAIYPYLSDNLSTNLKLKPQKRMGGFQSYSASAPEVKLTADVSVLRPAGKAPPLKTYGPRNTPVVPEPESFGASASWTVKVPETALKGVSDVYLDVAYQGDVARLFSGPEMLDDEYFIGKTWRIGLKRYADKLAKPLTLSIMPLREDSKVYFDASVKPAFENGQVARVYKIELTPEYELTLK